MSMVAVGIDLAKNVFAVHRVADDGKAAPVKPKVSRERLLPLIRRQAQACVGRRERLVIEQFLGFLPHLPTRHAPLFCLVARRGPRPAIGVRSRAATGRAMGYAERRMENNRHRADQRRSAAQALAAIPVASLAAAGDGAASEPFVLRVLGDSMLPEFAEGEVVVVEPGRRAVDGAFVLAWWDGEWVLRQLFAESGRWFLVALNPACMRTAIPDLSPVRGVVIQKSVPGRRRLTKRYVD